MFDNLSKECDCQDATNDSLGIAGRFHDNKINMNTCRISGNLLETCGTTLTIHIGYLRHSFYREHAEEQDWSAWHIGCQNRLTVWFEDGTRVDFERYDYATKRDYKLAIFNFFNEYITNGFNLGSNFGSKLQIAQEVEFMDI